MDPYRSSELVAIDSITKFANDRASQHRIIETKKTQERIEQKQQSQDRLAFLLGETNSSDQSFQSTNASSSRMQKNKLYSENGVHADRGYSDKDIDRKGVAKRDISSAEQSFSSSSKSKPHLNQNDVGSGSTASHQSPLRKRKLRSAAESNCSGRLTSQNSNRSASSQGTHNEEQATSKIAAHAKDLVIDTSLNPDKTSFYTAVYEFIAEQGHDLPLCIGDVLRVQTEDMHEDGWWYGCRTFDGKFGFFPSNFVHPYEAPDLASRGPSTYIQSPKHTLGRKSPTLPFSLGSVSLQGTGNGLTKENTKDDTDAETHAATKIQAICRGKRSRQQNVPKGSFHKDRNTTQHSTDTRDITEHSEASSTQTSHTQPPRILLNHSDSAPTIQISRSSSATHSSNRIMEALSLPGPEESDTLIASETNDSEGDFLNDDAISFDDDNHGASIVQMSVQQINQTERKKSQSEATKKKNSRELGSNHLNSVRRTLCRRMANKLVACISMAVLSTMLPIRLPNGAEFTLVDIIDGLRTRGANEGFHPTNVAIRLLRQAQATNSIPHDMMGMTIISLVPELLSLIFDTTAVSENTRIDAVTIVSNILAEHVEGVEVVQYSLSKLGTILVQDQNPDLNVAIFNLVGNFAGAGATARDLVLAVPSIRMAISRIIRTQDTMNPGMRNAVWALGNLFRGASPLQKQFPLDLTEALTSMMMLLEDDRPALIDLVWTIAFMTDSKRMAKAFAKNSLHADLVGLICQNAGSQEDGDDIMLLGLLRSLGCLICKAPNETFKHLSIELGERMLLISDTTEPMILKDVMWTFGNIMKLKPDFKEYMSNSGKFWFFLKRAITLEITGVRAEAILLLETTLRDTQPNIDTKYHTTILQIRKILQNVKFTDVQPELAALLNDATQKIITFAL